MSKTDIAQWIIIAALYGSVMALWMTKNDKS
jgi:hypothetical protein